MSTYMWTFVCFEVCRNLLEGAMPIFFNLLLVKRVVGGEILGVAAKGILAHGIRASLRLGSRFPVRISTRNC
jgi:hypothetical protein